MLHYAEFNICEHLKPSAEIHKCSWVWVVVYFELSTDACIYCIWTFGYREDIWSQTVTSTFIWLSQVQLWSGARFTTCWMKKLNHHFWYTSTHLFINHLNPLGLLNCM